MPKSPHHIEEEIKTRLIYAGGLKNDNPTKEAITSMADLIERTLSSYQKRLIERVKSKYEMDFDGEDNSPAKHFNAALDTIIHIIQEEQ